MSKNVTMVIFLFIGVMALSCRTQKDKQKHEAETYYKAEVYYLKIPLRGIWDFYPCIAEDFLDESIRDIDYNKFILYDKDSLRFISNQIEKTEKTYAPLEDYYMASTIVLLHSAERVDTLVDSTYPKLPMQFNSEAMLNGTLSLFLTESIGKHDLYWADNIDLFFYDGNMWRYSYFFDKLRL